MLPTDVPPNFITISMGFSPLNRTFIARIQLCSTTGKVANLHAAFFFGCQAGQFQMRQGTNKKRPLNDY
jgi:hypothetical protein